MLSLIEHYVPNFNRLNKKKKIEIILRGVNIDDDDSIDEYINIV